MNQIMDAAKKVMNAFPGAQCSTEDEFGSDSNCEMEDNLVVGDDFHRQEWLVGYDVPGGTHDSVTKKMIDVFGEPQRKCHRPDLGVDVNNWNVDKVHVVQVQNRITLIQNYTKR